MISNPKRRCIVHTCKNPALYGTCLPQHCEEHNNVDEINWVEKDCISCGLTNILNKEGKCQFCEPDRFNKTRLAKQNQVKHFLDANNITYISCDIVIDRGICGKERPDFLIDCGTHFVVLEVDENQHKERAMECERVRMINISQSLGLTTKFVRYNPDHYKVNNSKRDPSFGTRMKKLKEHLTFAIHDEATYFLSVKYLFFDDKEETQFENILIS